MLLAKIGLFKKKKKKAQNITCCPLLPCNASDALVFKHTTADISDRHIQIIMKLCNVYNTVCHRLKVEFMTIFNTVTNYCITCAEVGIFHDHKISNLSFFKQ